MAYSNNNQDWSSTQGKVTIAIVGTDGSDGPAGELNHATFIRIAQHVRTQIAKWGLEPNDVELVCNGTPWVNFVPIYLFVESQFADLSIHLPAMKAADATILDASSSTGKKINAQFVQFAETMRKHVDKHTDQNTAFANFDPVEIFNAALSKGATCHTYDTRNESNAAVAVADALIVFTWAGNIYPKQQRISHHNTSHRTWGLAYGKTRKHVPLDYMLNDEQLTRAPTSDKIHGATKRQKCVTDKQQLKLTFETSIRTTTVEGDLLNLSDEQKESFTFVAHQGNCTTNKAAGLANALFTAFPWADVYTNRTEPSTVGTIAVRSSLSAAPTQETKKRKRVVQMPPIVTMFAQYRGGTPTPNDTALERATWFNACLDKIATIAHLADRHPIVAFPFKIGCGMAGGDWNIYKPMITKWAKKEKINVVFVRLA